jgi:hypothetical protein
LPLLRLRLLPGLLGMLLLLLPLLRLRLLARLLGMLFLLLPLLWLRMLRGLLGMLLWRCPLLLLFRLLFLLTVNLGNSSGKRNQRGHAHNSKKLHIGLSILWTCLWLA